MAMRGKGEQLQIRVSALQKAAIRERAHRAGLGMSDWVLRQLFPPARERFMALVRTLADADTPTYVLAELNDLLDSLTADELESAVADPPAKALSAYRENYVAAMVEQAAGQKGVAPPSWTGSIRPLAEPVFGSSLVSLRLHLLTHSPPPFRRRNIFIDASVGDRV